MRPLLLALALLIPLSACGPTGCSAISNVTRAVNAPAHTVIDDKAVLAAEVAYGIALDTVLGNADKLTPAEKAQARAVIIAVERFRHPDGATTGPTTLQLALKAGNTTDLAAKFATFRALTAQLALIGGK